jgi:hypothetical protein
MARQLRLGPASGPRVLGVVAAAGLVVALVVTGRAMSGLRTGPSLRPTVTTSSAADVPYRIGERLVCPLRRPVLVTSDGRSYPPGHPVRPPPDAAPVACYETVAAAAAAGHALAPLPPGVMDLGGVYLVRTPAGVRGQCRRAAERLGFAVPCPALRPLPSLGAPQPAVCEPPSPCGEPGFGFLLEDTGFLVPSGYVGGFRDTGAHLAVAAARRPASPAVACAGERPVAAVTVRGTGGRLLQCPPGPGPHGDHLLLRWRERGTTMAVSVSGDTGLHHRLVLAVAAHLELVAPASWETR